MGFKQAEKAPSDALSGNYENFQGTWTYRASRYLGLRFCDNEAHSNWSRRPLRKSQLHYAAAEVWSMIAVTRAVCSNNLVSRNVIRRHLVVQERPRYYDVRKQLAK